MNSLARHIALRSTGPHRNLLRRIHETAQKKPIVFRWEVRIPPVH